MMKTKLLVRNLHRDVDPFTKAYIECALWSSITDNDEPLDKDYNWTHLTDETLARMIADCEKFQRDNSKLLCVTQSSNAREGGHCFWLSRNGHDGMRYPIRDMEAGAMKRLDKIMSGLRGLRAYVQGDCRGASLYILRRKDVKAGEDINSVYTRGVAVY